MDKIYTVTLELDRGVVCECLDWHTTQNVDNVQGLAQDLWGKLSGSGDIKIDHPPHVVTMDNQQLIARILTLDTQTGVPFGTREWTNNPPKEEFYIFVYNYDYVGSLSRKKA